MPDVNVLIYAHRADETTHKAYADWLAQMVRGPRPFALSVLVAVAFVRIATNKRIYRKPTPLTLALATVDELAGHPRCRIIAPAEDHWTHVGDLCRATRAEGKLVADAQHAALAIASGCTWVTRDDDFSRFERHGLSWQHLELS
jgi:hypothetical protein